MRVLFLLVVLAGFLHSCGGDAAEMPSTAAAETAPGQEDLLQGEWVSASDPNVSWAFANGQLTEGLKGAQNRSQSGRYTLSDDCLNGDGNGAKAADRYLNVLNPDRCFYIVSLTEQELTLSYVGRGNTLRFTKRQ